MENNRINRREFIQISVVAGTGLALGVQVVPAWLAAEDKAAVFAPSQWLRIDRQGLVTVTVHRTELGQGPRTALPQIVAEELEADWQMIRIVQADADAKYGSMTTGGSTSIRQNWMPLRKAGAAAREMLITAAAQVWGVDRATCKAEKGAVVHVPTGRRLPYGELVEAAAKVPVPENPPLKDPKDFHLVGTAPPRIDLPDKVNGKAVFGFDTRVPGMLVAAIARCPVFGGKAKSFDAGKATAVPGVKQVVPISTGVAVLADSAWAAFQGRDALAVTWDEGPDANLDSAGIRAMFVEKSKGAAEAFRRDGDAAKALAEAVKKLEAVYEVPFVAHAPMEPQNCVAAVRPDGCEIWAPSQTPQWARRTAAQILGLPEEKVTVHVTLVGGGFGRRLMDDYVREAVEVSKAVGKPVQVVWSREDDMRHDFYRPASYHCVQAGLDAEGKLTAWSHRVVAPSITIQLFGPEARGDEPIDAVDGAADLAYQVPNILVDYAMANTAVPIGWWRSVYNSQNPFVNESFLDEIAHAAGKDPLEFRRQLLPPDSRLRGVLELAAAKAGWGSPLPKGKGRGIAAHSCFGSWVADVAEVAVDAGGRVRVERVVCAIDCGQAVNPSIIASQLDGAVAFALTAALKSEITIEKGRAKQTDFVGFPLLRLDEMPAVEVHIVPSREAPGGVGEPGVPPVAPAVANAVFAATGKRVRRMPIRPSDLLG